MTATADTPPAVAPGVMGTWIAIGLCLAWTGTAFLSDMLGLNEYRRDEPHTGIIIAVLTPTALFLAAFALFRSVRGWTRSLDPALLALPHAWRTVGFSFIALWHHGILPIEFAAPAGLGDIAVAIAAPFVVVALWQRWKGAVIATVIFHLLGIVDFFFAILMGVSGAGIAPDAMSSVDPMTTFPMSWIPTAAVPLLLLGHVIALINLRMARVAR